LIADDDRANREILKAVLEKKGYSVTAFSDGKGALEALKSNSGYAVAILDWMMPFYNGIDICKYFNNSGKIDTYLILLTSKHEPSDIIAGLNSGANDYIVKPFDSQELYARVGVGLRMFNLQRHVSEYALKMEKLANERAQQLIHADRLSTIGMLSAGMAHEINNPLSFIEGNIKYFSDCWPTIKGALEYAKVKNTGDVDNINMCLEEFEDVINGIQNGISRITKIVNGLKLYSHNSHSEKKTCNLFDIIDQSLELCKNRLKYGIHINFERNLDDAQVFVDIQQMEQVFVNLLVNAADALETTADAKIDISIKRDVGTVKIYVEDNGPGFSDAVIGKIFNPFYTTKEPGKGTGLGLSICQGIIEAHQGKILAENRVPNGARFIVSLPAWRGDEF